MKFLHLLYLQYIDLIITLLYQHMLRAKNWFWNYKKIKSCLDYLFQ